jgi:hypothetical protein
MKFNRQLLKEDMHHAFVVIAVVIAIIGLGNLLLGKICTLRIIAGIPCPGCGLTRAFFLLLQGKVKDAFVMHPFWLPVLVIFVAFIVCRYFIMDEKIRKRDINIIWIITIVMIVDMFVFYFYRMAIYYPEKEPMVYDQYNLINKTIFY